MNAAANRPLVAVVLAAGKGNRMRSERPKVLHEAGGKPLLGWVLAAARAFGCRRLVIVVGQGAEAVRAAFPGDDLTWVVQNEQRGTGHALAQTAAVLGAERQLVLTLSGDVPLLRPSTLERLAETAAGAWGAMAVATPPNPGRLGRVVTRDGETLERIIEAADAAAEELAIPTINAGIYALPAPEIFGYLEQLTPSNAQHELYLTDALSAAARAGETIRLLRLDDPLEALGVNTRAELAAVHQQLLDRYAAELMAAGVTILEPARTAIEPGVRVAADTVLHAGVCLLGHTEIGAGCVLHQGAWLRNSVLGPGVTIEPYSVLDGARIEAGCRVGPFARLRPKSHLLAGARVGNFVEIKASRLGENSRAGHLAYLGDAEIGAGANIGAGTVTCNFDGVSKHRTEIGPGAFIGSDTQLVAPVKVGAGAATGAGSVITRDVPAGALAVARARQRNLPARAGGLRRRPPSSDAS
jgi:bifunctional UDP-N-acetylglucosamine pyrophosphorylase/glucosamine-1-phosphate N-acetyltransferase